MERISKLQKIMHKNWQLGKQQNEQKTTEKIINQIHINYLSAGCIIVIDQ